MSSVGDAFGWAFKDPSWVGKVVVQGLIGIIPIVGWIAGAGWLMLAFDNARAGRNELPQAGFHLERGIGIFGVYVIYAIVLNIPGWLLDGIGGGVRYVCNFNNNCSNTYVGGPLSGLGGLWSFAVSLFLWFLLPSLIVIVYHSGFSGGFDVGRVFSYATSNVSNSVVSGLLMWVSALIGGFGILLCCVGALFTIPYAITVHAGIAAWYERQQAAPAAPAMPPGTPAA